MNLRKNLDTTHISQRAAQGSLYRGAGRQRRSERLKGVPYAQGRWPCIFSTICDQRLFSSPVCDSVGDVPEGVPPRIPCMTKIQDEWRTIISNPWR